MSLDAFDAMLVPFEHDEADQDGSPSAPSAAELPPPPCVAAFSANRLYDGLLIVLQARDFAKTSNKWVRHALAKHIGIGHDKLDSRMEEGLSLSRSSSQICIRSALSLSLCTLRLSRRVACVLL